MKVLAALLLALSAAFQDAPAPSSDPRANILRQLRIESLDDVENALGHAVDPESADALESLARHHAREGRHEFAELLFGDALRMRLELVGPADKESLYAAIQVQLALSRLGRLTEGVEFGELYLARLEDSVEPDPQFFATFLLNHGVSLQAVGELEGSVECQRRSLELTEARVGTQDAAYAMGSGNLALSLGELGLRREAFEWANASLRLRAVHFGDGSSQYARGLAILGTLYLQAGDVQSAEVALRRAEEVLRRAPEPDASDLGDVLQLLGGLCQGKGDGEGAIAALRESRALLAADLGADHPVVALAEVDLGFVLTEAGLGREALPYLERALATLRASLGEHNSRTHLAGCALALALADIGRAEEAVEAMSARVEQSAAWSVEAPELEPFLHLHFATCLEKAGDPAGAEAELRAALAGIERVYGPDSPKATEPLARMAGLTAERGELAEAEAEALRALEIARLHRGRVVGDELARELHAGHLRLDEIADLVAGLRVARGEFDGALAALEEERAWRDASPQVPGDAAQHERLLDAEEGARARLRALEARREAHRERGAAPAASELEALAAARNALAAASAALARLSGPRVDPASVADARALRASLAPGELVLSLSWSELHVAWIAVAADDEEGRSSGGLCASGRAEVASLKRDVQWLCAALATDPRARGGPLPPLPAALGELARRIAARGAKRVWIVPDGPLGSLPPERWFEGLAASAPDLALLPSASARLARASGTVAERSARSVVLGDPHFGGSGVAMTRSGRELARLPATRAEASYVAACLERGGAEVRLLLGEEATRAKLEQAIEGAGILHLATHGFPGSARAPYDAALALASAPLEGADEWADALTLDRLLRRWGGRLEGCELVVLSACETNRAVEMGTGVYSLATGFLRAGAGSVVATLWRVDEVATALLMGRFVENLSGARPDLEDGGPRLAPGAALREAQQWLRAITRDEVREASQRMGLGEDGGVRAGSAEPAPAPKPGDLRPYADPYFWSGFVRIG